MEDTKSRNSSTYKGSNKQSENSAGTAKTGSKTKKEEPSDKKKLKVLKNALKEERSAREE
jgi:hypothetical protein